MESTKYNQPTLIMVICCTALQVFNQEILIIMLYPEAGIHQRQKRPVVYERFG